MFVASISRRNEQILYHAISNENPYKYGKKGKYLASINTYCRNENRVSCKISCYARCCQLSSRFVVLLKGKGMCFSCSNNCDAKKYDVGKVLKAKFVAIREKINSARGTKREREEKLENWGNRCKFFYFLRFQHKRVRAYH